MAPLVSRPRNPRSRHFHGETGVALSAAVQPPSAATRVPRDRPRRRGQRHRPRHVTPTTGHKPAFGRSTYAATQDPGLSSHRSGNIVIIIVLITTLAASWTHHLAYADAKGAPIITTCLSSRRLRRRSVHNTERNNGCQYRPQHQLLPRHRRLLPLFSFRPDFPNSAFDKNPFATCPVIYYPFIASAFGLHTSTRSTPKSSIVFISKIFGSICHNFASTGSDVLPTARPARSTTVQVRVSSLRNPASPTQRCSPLALHCSCA